MTTERLDSAWSTSVTGTYALSGFPPALQDLEVVGTVALALVFTVHTSYSIRVLQ